MLDKVGFRPGQGMLAGVGRHFNFSESGFFGSAQDGPVGTATVSTEIEITFAEC